MLRIRLVRARTLALTDIRPAPALPKMESEHSSGLANTERSKKRAPEPEKKCCVHLSVRQHTRQKEANRRAEWSGSDILKSILGRAGAGMS